MAQTSGNKFHLLLTLLTIVSGSLIVASQCPKSVPVDPKIVKQRSLDFKAQTAPLVKVGPKKYILKKNYEVEGPAYYNFQPKPDDVYLSSFPRAGHNWVSQLIWLLVNNLNITEAKAKPIADRVPLLEDRRNKVNAGPKGKQVQLHVDKMKSPRVIRTQLPCSLIPKVTNSSNKLIYLVRNPKDNIVSNYKYAKTSDAHKFVGSIDRYWHWMGQDMNLYNPYWDHLKEGMALKSRPNSLILYAEEKPDVLINKVSNFLGKKYSPKQLKPVGDYLKSIEQIEQKSWKKEFSPDVNKKVNVWIKKNRGDIKFPCTKNLYS